MRFKTKNDFVTKYRLYYPLLKKFAEANSEQRKNAINKMNDTCLKMICECCYNVLFNPSLITHCQREFIKESMQKESTHLCHCICDAMCVQERREKC